MTTVALFHSALGLREVERAAAGALRADGHRVVLPDLYRGRRAEDLESGLRLMREIGWDAICAEARSTARELPEDTVLAGVSMGAGVVGELWKDRPATPAVLLIHGHAVIPTAVRPGTRVELHAGSADPFVAGETLAHWIGAAKAQGLSPRVWQYPGEAHFFTDPASADYDAVAAETLWTRARQFLATD
jgi:dienelactone hydrolase